MNPRNPQNCPTVVLVPGLWMPSWMLVGLQRRLRRAGWPCVRFHYPWVRGSLQENSQRLAIFVAALGDRPVHLVGHSMGGLLALHTAARHVPMQVRRIVMLGSPYADCCAARALSGYALGRCLLGKTLPAWLAGEKPQAPRGVEVGVLAGTLSAGLGMLIARSLPSPHDGVVAACETRVPGMKDFVEIRINHFGMLLSARVARLTGRFLEAGVFADAGAIAAEWRPSDSSLAAVEPRDEKT